MKKFPQALIILDGFGYRKETKYNAIAQAHKPTIDMLMANYPHTIIKASGEAVGLLPDNMGNSEVGHRTIGTGRIIQQPLTTIHKAIDDKSFFEKSILKNDLEKIKELGTTLHIMGLLSDAGVHAHIKHLFAYLDAAKTAGLTKIIVHPFLDGRDMPPESGIKLLKSLKNKLRELQVGKIGSICGRFYAMDRDKNWMRTKEAYDLLTQKQSESFSNWKKHIKNFYDEGITDEFIPPFQVDPSSTIKNQDGIIFFNFRPDRARQLTAAFVDPNFNEFPTKKLELAFFLATRNYSSELNCDVLFEEEPVTKNTLMEILNENGISTFRIAETEKYAHITYFFNGGKETTLNLEERVLIPSLVAKNYIEHPEMSAKKITAAIINSLENNPKDFYLINYANADMVGHSGNMEATIKAIECLDKQVKQLYEEIIEKQDGTIYLTADHGNAEEMFDETTNQPITSHTKNPVPFVWINKKLEGKTANIPVTQLSEIAPFVLKEIGLNVPDGMK
ncbi:MAG: 2,3-bisphosphoglycerate-independent phosphoglycerate mutase [candidate division TM6 bacterium GW2011_GWF2_32_72]|nr:MAG: 2,3-bisphosphoglycerate-independent phosphoglycerate mutase [candidate division TM6 bacterium GW2011_GWF2_32_72]